MYWCIFYTIFPFVVLSQFRGFYPDDTVYTFVDTTALGAGRLGFPLPAVVFGARRFPSALIRFVF